MSKKTYKKFKKFIIKAMIFAIGGFIIAMIIYKPIIKRLNNMTDEEAAKLILGTSENKTESSTEQGTVKESSTITSEVPIITEFSMDLIPEYSGEAFVYINDNMPFFSAEEYFDAEDNFINCSELDELGRCGVAFMNAGYDLLPECERGDISEIHPSGWVQAKYGEEYLYNRCHLLAFSLTGIGGDESMDELLERDLITGTRYLNIEGMWPIEETVLNYVKENPENHCLYRVTPIYEGDNLVCSGVLMEGLSVEDLGIGVKFCVYCYNVQPGINIEYDTGKSSLNPS